MERLKRKVEKKFGIAVKQWKVIKDEKKSSIVVRVVTKEGKEYALKSLYIPTERQLFISQSEQMLAERGVDLARPVPAQNGDLYMLYKKYPYVLNEWVNGKSAKLGSQSDLIKLVKTMAHFHHASQNLEYPSNISTYEHPHWVKEYKDRVKSIEKWMNRNKESQNRNKAIINRHIAYFLRMAKKALKLLKTSRYDDYIAGRAASASLVHGDYHHNNVILDHNKLYMIDFEDVRYDLPSKDLLRIYSMYTKNHAFDSGQFRNMLRAYEKVNALAPEVRQLVLIDLMFPHIFERLLRKKKYVGMSPDELKHRIKQEKKKAAYVYKHYFKRSQANGRASD